MTNIYIFQKNLQFCRGHQREYIQNMIFREVRATSSRVMNLTFRRRRQIFLPDSDELQIRLKIKMYHICRE